MFEYMIQRADGFVPVQELNELGKQGWEIVSILPDESGYDYIFKRFRGHLGSFAQGSPVLRGQTNTAVKPPDSVDIMEFFKNVN